LILFVAVILGYYRSAALLYPLPVLFAGFVFVAAFVGFRDCYPFSLPYAFLRLLRLVYCVPRLPLLRSSAAFTTARLRVTVVALPFTVGRCCRYRYRSFVRCSCRLPLLHIVAVCLPITVVICRCLLYPLLLRTRSHTVDLPLTYVVRFRCQLTMPFVRCVARCRALLAALFTTFRYLPAFVVVTLLDYTTVHTRWIAYVSC